MSAARAWLAGTAASVLLAGALLGEAAGQTAASTARDGDASVMEQGDASASAPASGSSDAGASARATADAELSEADGGVDEAPTPADDTAATRALGEESSDAPDPVTTEAERLASAEGEALSGNPEPANEIAALSDRACLRGLQRAHVPYERASRHVRGIGIAVRVTGTIEGVRYRASERHEINELMDCRLALALVRFSRLLKALDVREVIHYSTYRPPSEDQAARQPLQTRHAGGLAIDAAVFVRNDGHRFSVLEHFRGHLGEPVCGPSARVMRDDGARFLRTIACDSARRGLFHVVLTPNHNVEHRNHFHLEVTRGVHWQYVH